MILHDNDQNNLSWFIYLMNRYLMIYIWWYSHWICPEKITEEQAPALATKLVWLHLNHPCCTLLSAIWDMLRHVLLRTDPNCPRMWELGMVNCGCWFTPTGATTEKKQVKGSSFLSCACVVYTCNEKWEKRCGFRLSVISMRIACSGCGHFQLYLKMGTTIATALSEVYTTTACKDVSYE